MMVLSAFFAPVKSSKESEFRKSGFDLTPKGGVFLETFNGMMEYWNIGFKKRNLS